MSLINFKLRFYSDKNLIALALNPELLMKKRNYEVSFITFNMQKLPISINILNDIDLYSLLKRK